MTKSTENTETSDCLFVPGFVIGLIAGSLLIGLILAFEMDELRATRATMKTEAIEHGAAQYNPKTGEFEWIERGTEKGD